MIILNPVMGWKKARELKTKSSKIMILPQVIFPFSKAMVRFLAKSLKDIAMPALVQRKRLKNILIHA